MDKKLFFVVFVAYALKNLFLDNKTGLTSKIPF